jgi:hypothetical protein
MPSGLRPIKIANFTPLTGRQSYLVESRYAHRYGDLQNCSVWADTPHRGWFVHKQANEDALHIRPLIERDCHVARAKYGFNFTTHLMEGEHGDIRLVIKRIKDIPRSAKGSHAL